MVTDKKGSPGTKGLDEQFRFSWRKDRDGYDIDRTGPVHRILRRGGELVEYIPDECNPLPHVVLANLHTQLEKFRFPGRGIASEFWARVFENWETALLGFVNEYGFLGSQNYKTEGLAGAETLDHLMTQASSLRKFFELKPDAKSDAATFNSFASPRLNLRAHKDKQGNRIEIYIPATLLDWIWVRSWQTSGIGYCTHCLKPMALGKNFQRSDKEFCSVSHRVVFGRLTERAKAERRKIKLQRIGS